MNIYIVTGQQDADVLFYSKELEKVIHQVDKEEIDIIHFPETKICHSYTLCEHVMEIVHKYYEEDKNLIIVTYSEVVLDSVRLWIARNKFENTICINALSNGDYVGVPINENGEMEEWIKGVFDIKTVILRELFQIRKVRLVKDES